MNLLGEKLLSTSLIVILSLFCGYLPLLLAKKYDFSSIDMMQPLLMKKEKKNPKNIALSFMLNLGGGVLLANCFCHWLPEVREGLETVDTLLPMAEMIMVCGFFFIAGLEEILHHFLHPHQTHEHKEALENLNYGTVEDKDETREKEKEFEKRGVQVKATLRTIFVVLALSFHSTVEGMALGLESESSGIWMNTLATALHKFVMSFAVGVECISNKVSLCVYSTYIIVFSLAAALGSTIGIILTELSLNTSSMDLPVQVLQGIATGTIIYVVFFEILPKAKAVGGTGTQHILAMVLGFGIFIPSIYFHTIEHEHEETPVCPNMEVLEYCWTLSNTQHQ